MRWRIAAIAKEEQLFIVRIATNKTRLKVGQIIVYIIDDH
jgi:hypothetical protein